MRKIFVGKSKYLPFDFALIDDEDYEYISQWRWHSDNKGYVVRRVRRNGKKLVVYMHREIMRTPQGLVTDHINGLRSDNRKENLRICTDGQNKYNQGKQADNTSGYKGVHWQKQINRWYSRIRADGKDRYLGTYDTAELAATAYNVAALQYHGEFAKLNVIKGE